MSLTTWMKTTPADARVTNQVKRVREINSMNRVGNMVESTEEQTESLMKPLARHQNLVRRPPTRIAIKVKGRIRFINSVDVVAVLAEGNYVVLQQESSSYLLRETISMVAEALEPFGFVRIHRSVIVNSAFVEEIKPYPTGDYGLRLKGGKEYTVTRTYKENLKSLAEFWIGSRAFFPHGGQ